MSKRTKLDILTEHYKKIDENWELFQLGEQEDKNSSEYQEFFRKKMKEAGIDSLDNLSDKEKKKFFNQIDKSWIADDEEHEKYDSQYQKFFNKKLKEYGVKSPFKLDPQEREKFFEEVDREWKADKET